MLNREAILTAAADPRYRNVPYALPPDPHGIESIDCSLYVLQVFAAAGQPFPAGVRTAEDIRQASETVDEEDTLPGDLIFFQQTYPTLGASHIGISLGDRSGKMWDAHERSHDPRNAVGLSDLNSYWQQHWMMVGRYDHGATPQPPAPSMLRMRVEAWGLNLRKGPTEQAERIRTLAHGTVVRVAPYAWREILDEQGLPIGWAAEEYLQET